MTGQFKVGDRVRVEDPGADDYLRTGMVVEKQEGKLLVQLHGDRDPTTWEEEDLETTR